MEPPSTALVLDDVLADGSPRYGTRADCAPGGRFAAAWLALAESSDDGRGPQVVLRSRLADETLRTARGITSIVEVPTDLDGTTLTVAHPPTMP